MKYHFVILALINIPILSAQGQPNPCLDPPTPGCYYYRPHEDCTRVWNCQNPFTPFLDRCTDGRYWNQERCICDLEDNVDECVGGTRPPPPTTTTTEGPPETEGTIPPTTTLPPGQCSSTGVHKIPHLENCGSYYFCNYGVKELKNCPPRLHFDPEYDECNFPEEVRCGLVLI